MARKPRPKPPIKQKALDLLSRRRLSKGELRAKLLLRDYPEAEIDQLLERFIKLRYLDDESLAADYAEYRLKSKPMGKKLMKLELKRRLLPDDLVDKTVDKAFSAITEEELAVKVVRKLRGNLSDNKKIYNRLLRLGFNYDTIEYALSDLKRSD